jgi:hypothetical protein
MSIARAVLLAAITAMIVACGDKKEPLTPDNPAADPLMMDAGGGGGDTPAPASSGEAK